MISVVEEEEAKDDENEDADEGEKGKADDMKIVSMYFDCISSSDFEFEFESVSRSARYTADDASSDSLL